MKSVLVSDIEPFCNRHGSIRVGLVRKHYGINLQKNVLSDIVELYMNWRDTVEVMPLLLTYVNPTYIDLNNTPVDVDKWINNYTNNTGNIAVRFNEKSNIVCYYGYDSEWVTKKCCKRGNDVYIRIVRDKFKPLVKSKNHKQFFTTIINDKRKRIRKTKLLYLTGTCNPSITGNISNSWICFGSYWNSFITNIREMFNGIEYVRAWQSQENGYPHFHALIYFKDFDFTSTYWKEDKSWRIHNRQKLNGKSVRDKIKNAWKWGNLDIKCCDDTKKALTDLVKYITRDLEGGESDLTNAMVWYYGKQSYSFSKGFTSLFEPNLNIAEVSDDDLINAESVIQRNNSKKKLIRIEVFPILRQSTLNDLIKNTLYFWENLDNPPPPINDYLNKFVDLCKPVKLNKKELEDGSFVDIITYDYK